MIALGDFKIRRGDKILVCSLYSAINKVEKLFSLVMRLNFKLILYIIGLLLIFNGSAMILTAIVSLIFSDGVVNEIITSAAILMSLGLILMLSNKIILGK